LAPSFRIYTSFFIIAAFAAWFGTGNAQPYSWMGKPSPYRWFIGVGWTAIDDDGRDLCQPFDVEQSWNYLYYPTRIVFDKYLKKGMSLDFSGAYMQYSSSKLVNDTIGVSGMFISADANFKYSFNRFFRPWFNPYVSGGIGGTHREAYRTAFVPTVQAALGVNFWIGKFGIQLQTSGKVGVVSDFFAGDADYMQHNLSLIYKFTDRQGSSFNSKPRYKHIHKVKSKYKGKAAR
jgi:hypothetical protein